MSSSKRGTPLYKHTGCRACRNLGYTRTAGHLRAHWSPPTASGSFATTASARWALKQAATEEGMLTLRQDGWIKVLNGRTTLEEVLRVTKGDLVGEMMNSECGVTEFDRDRPTTSLRTPHSEFRTPHSRMPDFAYTARDADRARR